MKKRVAIALARNGKLWTASAAGYPDCCSAGGSLAQAEKRMAAALSSRIAMMLNAGELLPPDAAQSAVVEVDVVAPPPKLPKVNGDLLTTSEAAVAYGKTRAAWRQACERGSIPGAVSKGGMWLIPRAAAVEYGKTAKRGRPFKGK